MMDRNQANALASRLGEAIGIADLALDEGGTCTLVIDNGAVIVSLGHNTAAGALDLMTCLDQVEPTPANLSRLLQANLGWRGSGGATFALDPTGGAVMLQRRIGDAEATEDGLKAALEGLVATTEAWIKRFSDQQATVDDATTADVSTFGSIRP
jgi:hypothetical protein